VEATKTALIVFDGTEAGKIAEAVSAALKGYQTAIRPAESFAGTDLLPAGIFFLGCENPEPASFAPIGEMLRHINLAGRPCGVFSTNNKALKFLSRLVKDSGAALGEPLLAKDAAPGIIKKWVQGIVKS
jgi:hypothetical protein